MLIADDPGDFAAATLRLLDDPALAQRLSEAGRQLVETHYDWRAHRAGLQAVYHDAVARRPTSSISAAKLRPTTAQS